MSFIPQPVGPDNINATASSYLTLQTPEADLPIGSKAVEDDEIEEEEQEGKMDHNESKCSVIRK